MWIDIWHWCSLYSKLKRFCTPEYEQRTTFCVRTKKPDKLRCTVRDQSQNKFSNKWHSNTAQSAGTWRTLPTSVLIRVSLSFRQSRCQSSFHWAQYGVSNYFYCINKLLSLPSHGGVRFTVLWDVRPSSLVDLILRSAGTYIPNYRYWLRCLQLTLAVVCCPSPLFCNQ